MPPSLSVNRVHPAALLFPLVVLVGTAGVFLPAFGRFSALGFSELSLTPWQTLLATPTLGVMVGKTLFVGVAATVLALLLALVFTITCWNTRLWKITERTLAPLISIPHSALAIGVLFLLSPSGFASRLLSGPLRWQHPPDLLTVNDPWGISLILTLVMKEAPFLVLVLIAAVRQTSVSRLLQVGASLGYSPLQCWLKLVWPQLYAEIRLSIFIVLSFSLSVVDVSLIIGPALPPLLPVQILQWLRSPDIDMYLPAAAASVLLLGIVLAAVFIWVMVERFLQKVCRSWLTGGYRGNARGVSVYLGQAIWGGMLFLALVSLLVVFIWSFAWRWRYPDILPSIWSLKGWVRYFPQITNPLATTLSLAVMSTALGMIFAVALLERLPRSGHKGQALVTASFYLPLLLPQMTFLMGIQSLLLPMNVDGTWIAVMFSHFLFVFPYSYLSLEGFWKQYDQRYTVTGLLLSGSGVITFLKVKLPMLLPCLLTTLALGIAVSTALYLPTVIMGAGRFETLTTEAVALSSGGNRRVLAVYAVIQQMLPLLFFSVAILLPRWLFRNRRGMLS